MPGEGGARFPARIGALDIGDAASPRRAPSGPPSRIALWAVIAPLVLLVIANNLSTALLGALVDNHPLTLIGLSSSNRNLILASDDLDALSFYGVGTLRLFAPDPLFYLLGFWYGDGAVRWMERRSPQFGRIFRSAEGLFNRAGYPVVFIAPNNAVCLFAGASLMNIPAFLVVNLAGTLTRLWLVRWLGDTFQAPLDAIRGFIADNRLIFIALGVGVVAYSIWSQRRSGEDELTSLTHLDEEIAEEEP